MDRKERDKEIQQLATELTKRLADEGRLIELGWLIFSSRVIPKDAPEIQHQEMRKAFMAGAEHTFSSMFTFMEAGTEPTDNDLRRMDQLYTEIKSIRKEMIVTDPRGGTPKKN